jgi:hypothetical protein
MAGTIGKYTSEEMEAERAELRIVGDAFTAQGDLRAEAMQLERWRDTDHAGFMRGGGSDKLLEITLSSKSSDHHRKLITRHCVGATESSLAARSQKGSHSTDVIVMPNAMPALSQHCWRVRFPYR